LHNVANDDKSGSEILDPRSKILRKRKETVSADKNAKHTRTNDSDNMDIDVLPTTDVRIKLQF